MVDSATAMAELIRGPVDGTGANRVHAHHPVRDVDVVKMLLDDLVAADPDEGIPSAVLKLVIAPLRVTRPLLNHRAANPVGVRSDDVTDRAVLDPVLRLHIGLVVSPLGAGHHCQTLLFTFARGGHEAVRANRIRGKRFFAEDVLAGVNSGLKVHRSVAGRRGQNHEVHIGFQQLLIGVRPVASRDPRPEQGAAVRS